MKDRGIIETFIKELERDRGAIIASSCQHPGGNERMAPDYRIMTHTGEAWGVEITELVDHKTIEKAKLDQRAFATWPDAEMIATFRAIVAKKDKPGAVKGGPYDRYILLVHIEEDIIPVEHLISIFGVIEFETILVDDIYLLVSYDPSLQRYPLIKLKTTTAKPSN